VQSDRQHDDGGVRGWVVSGPEDPRPDADWNAFRAARDRFFARVRTEAMDDPPESGCPEVVPNEWTAGRREAPPDPRTG
jgi:hypothetical protein